MMSEKQFIESQKDCANMLGMSLSEYEEYCKKIKVPKQNIDEEKNEYDNSILEFLGLTPEDLKFRKNNELMQKLEKYGW